MNLRANIEAGKRNYLPRLFLSIKIGLKFLKLFQKFDLRREIRK